MKLKFVASRFSAMKIIKFVKEDTGVDVRIRSKKRHISITRGLAMLAIREITGLSFPAIGRVFGVDHTTVIYHCKKLKDDELARQGVAVIRAELEAAR